MLSETTVGIVLHGEVADTPSAWRAWIALCESIAAAAGRPLTHVALSGDAFSSGKMLTLARMRKKIDTALARGDRFAGIEFDSLPRDFGTAIFDFETSWMRSVPAQQVSVCVDESLAATVITDETIGRMREQIRCVRGEVFQISRREGSANYLLMQPRQLRTLRILRTL
jgi:hypothetical protein